jgi:two-component system, NarL family, response regulator DesR
MHTGRPDYQKMRLMIVDDHASTREMIRNFLDLPGIMFCECASGEEALRQAREFKPNWITVDVNMPGLDGFQAAEALRAEHPAAHIIIVTGYNEPHFRKLSNSAGAVGLICKENLAALHMMLSQEMARPVPPAPAAEI